MPTRRRANARGMKPTMLSISAAERETGLSKETLRVWERRYGFPLPARDAQGERSYPLSQIEKLRIVKRLVDAGLRPSHLVPLSVDQLQRLGEQGAAHASREGAPSSACAGLMEVLRGHEIGLLRGQLRQAQARLGVSAFVNEVVAPLNTQVGDAWMRGQIGIYQEHAYTEAVQAVLRAAIHSLPETTTRQRPCVLLSTLPGEPHGLGLLMAEAIFAAEGAQCVPLGVQTPVWDLVLAARAYQTDVVALSFTGCMNPNQVVEALAELRAKLPPAVEVWAGGSAPALHRRPVAGVVAMKSLTELPDAVRRWRLAHV